jgi:hypothetical protein
MTIIVPLNLSDCAEIYIRVLPLNGSVIISTTREANQPKINKFSTLIRDQIRTTCSVFLSTALQVFALIDQADVSLVSWRIYAQYIKDFMTAGQALVPGKYFLFVIPPTEYGLRCGNPVPNAVTNWDIFGRVDSLQSGDSLLFETTGPSHVDHPRA